MQPKLRFPEFKDNYKEQRIDNILKPIMLPVSVDKKQRYKEIGIRSHGKGIFYKPSITGKELGNKRVFNIVKDALIFNIVFAWEHALAVTSLEDENYIASHRFPMYLPNNDLCNTQYMHKLFLTDKGKSLLELASPGGAGRNKTLGRKHFNELKVFVPSTPEQTKIADFLSAVDKKISLLEQQQQAWQNYKKGMMQKLFSSELCFKDENGQDFPEWEEIQLSQLGTTYNGLTGKNSDHFGFGKPYITYKQVFDASIIKVENCGLVEVYDYEKQNLVKKGDVIFTVSSETADEVAISSVILSDIQEDMYLNSFCFGFRFSDEKMITPKFSVHLFRSPGFRKDVSILAQGSTRYNISKVNMMKLYVKLPCLEEQQKIADCLSGLDNKIENINEQLNQMREWKKGLLQQMFV